MVLKYVPEICVGLDIAIISMGYPILMSNSSTVGEKYNSKSLSELYENMIPINRPIKKFKFTLFEWVIILCLLSFIPKILNLQPIIVSGIEWLDWILSNSADLIILFVTAIFCTLFILLAQANMLFLGRTNRLIDFLIHRTKSKSDNKYYDLSINEITISLLSKKENTIQKTLLNYYATRFRDEQITDDHKGEVYYPDYLYDFVEELIENILETDKVKLGAIEHRAVSGVWFKPDLIEQGRLISTKTYQRMWYNLLQMARSPKHIKMFWRNSFQYYRLNLHHYYPQYEYNSDSGQHIIVNQSEIDIRDKEKFRFLSFHLCMGGMLLQQRQIESIKFMFTFTQSEPASFEILPENPTELLEFFILFNVGASWSNHNLPFRPYLDGTEPINSEDETRGWVCQYIALLFVRALVRSHRRGTELSQPNLPEETIQLINVFDSINAFRFNVDRIIKDEELMDELNFQI